MVCRDGDLQVTGATQAFWQAQGKFSVRALPGTQPRGRCVDHADGHVGIQDHLAGALVAHHDTILVACRHHGSAVVHVFPAQREQAAGLNRRSINGCKVAYLQVGRRHARQIGDVVGLRGSSRIALSQIVAAVFNDSKNKPSRRLRACGPGKLHAAGDRFTRGQTGRRHSARPDGVENNLIGLCIDQHKSVRPRGRNGFAATIDRVPGHGYGLAGFKVLIRTDDHRLGDQVGVRRQGHVDDAGGLVVALSVALCVAFADKVVCVSHHGDAQIPHRLQAIRQTHLVGPRTRVARADGAA